MQMRRRLLDTLKDFPAYNAIWPSLISSCRKLQEINDRINCLIHPDDRPSLAEIKKWWRQDGMRMNSTGKPKPWGRHPAPPGRVGRRHRLHVGKLLPGTRQRH
ncbi:hypothetical protein M5E88_04025 [Akkermansia muciniphila]|nr:hypothetical protein M5E88_04025 [Akkermansia muciniphila]